jgi:hypothetical protein
MITPLVTYGLMKLYFPVQFPESLFVIVGITTIVWVAMTFATSPVPQEQLEIFYRRVHPGGPGWKAVQARLPEVKGDDDFRILWSCWLAGIMLVYSSLFGIGSLIFGDHLESLGYAVCAGVSAWWINRSFARIGFGTLAS